MTAQNFFDSITASTSFLKLPLESQAQIIAHASRFGRPGPVEAKAAAIAAGLTGNTLSLIRRGHQILASQQTTASTTNMSVPAGTITREAFNKLSHAERNQFFRNGGKIAAPEHHLSAWQSVNDRINPPKKQL